MSFCSDPDVNLTLRHISDCAGGHRAASLNHVTPITILQISVGGKTTSLGDHETEEEAARAFDRAAINRSGHAEATTNFIVADYAAELDQLICALLVWCLYTCFCLCFLPDSRRAFRPNCQDSVASVCNCLITENGYYNRSFKLHSGMCVSCLA